jgi:hypothetical protein
MRRVDPLFEELLSAGLAITGLGVVLAAVYWLATGLSPWPGLVLGEVIGGAWGVVILTLTSPRRRR